MNRTMSRRTFVAATAAASVSAPFAMGAYKNVPVGLELYSVRDEFTKDDMGTLVDVAKMGYEVVEFWAPYFNWTPAHAREIRAQLDGLGVKCLSTHNSAQYFNEENLGKAIELNQIIGSKYIVMASGPRMEGIDGWKALGDRMTGVAEQLRPLGMATGFHNHAAEWAQVGVQRPMDVLAASTPRDFVLQLDVGTAVAAGADPVAWIKAHAGRIRSIHCKDWGAGQGADRGYRVLFGEGDSPWKAIFEAVEAVGGVEYYLIEQEGSRFSSLETAEKCLATYRQMRG